LTPAPGVAYGEVAGTNVGEVSGTIYTQQAPDSGAKIATVRDDLIAAFSDLANRSGGTDPSGGTGELGGLILKPGIYLASALLTQVASGTFQITTGDLTLDAQNDPNAVFVFQMDANGPMVGDNATPRNVTLINGAQAKNVYWATNGSAAINPVGGGTMVGTVLGQNGVTIGSATSTTVTNLNGRAFSLANPLVTTNAVITVPAP